MLLCVMVSVSAVSAADNMTEEIISIETDNSNEIINENAADSIEYDVVSVCADDNLTVSEIDDELREGSYFREGPDGYIDSYDKTLTHKSSTKYSVRLVGESPSGESVSFIVYKGDSGVHVGTYSSIADSNGYAYLNKDLEPGKYWVKMVSDNYGSVYNTLTVKINGYRDAKIDITDTYYKYGPGDVIFHWEGYLKGYFNIYKGNKLIHKKLIYPKASKVLTDDDFSQYVYLTKKLALGTYTVKITNTNGKVIKKASFKVTKMPTYVYRPNVKFTSGGTKHLTVTVYNKIDDDSASGSVKVTIDGKTYKAKLNGGEANIKIKVPSKTKTYTCKASFLENSKFKSSSKTFKITVKKPVTKKIKKTTEKSTINKKSNSKYVTLKVKYHKFISKTVKGDRVFSYYTTTNGQYSPGIYIEAWGGSTPSSPKHIKLTKATFFFKKSNGKIVTTTKSPRYGMINCKLNGYTPYKVKVFYR